jgi:malate synthase
MEKYVSRSGLRVAQRLAEFVERRALPGTGVTGSVFWLGLSKVLAEFSPRNQALLDERALIQRQIDLWYTDDSSRTGYGKSAGLCPHAFLQEIGYLPPDPPAFEISTSNVDAELAKIAGPQLVVPMQNARFLLNAANARWGSLYDALYGTDAIPGLRNAGPYDPQRGEMVVAWAKAFLDDAAPLAEGRWADWSGGELVLADQGQLVGRSGDSLLLCNNGLHIEIRIDPKHPIGARDPAGIADIIMESAVSTICDLEDSVSVVDASDKVAAYENWLGLMKGDLVESFTKGGKLISRHLAADRVYCKPDGTTFSIPGRSLLLVRNVGMLMSTSAILMSDGGEAPEGIVDAAMTAMIALHDLLGKGAFNNSRTGAIYIVKPKLHGPRECAFTNDLFDAIEDMLGLERHTIKIGVMDEERRTSANLAACIAAVKGRIAFINTGFLDRTGDEIHTAMMSGPMPLKSEMKASRWFSAYEDRNLQIGLACGFTGKAQIGKGMWVMPDKMRDLLDQKIAHPMAGASTAWVPSPSAATLHATHYHRVNVARRQDQRKAEPIAALDDLLFVPAANPAKWNSQQLRDELDNNTQGILGYVVRWIDQGIGCSKVPDINDIGLMEDRATLRIASQLLANWLLHGVITANEVDGSLQRMARQVDKQNASDASYRKMMDDPEHNCAYQVARALIFEGGSQPNGYTEPLLHEFRLKVKQQALQAAAASRELNT